MKRSSDLRKLAVALMMSFLVPHLKAQLIELQNVPNASTVQVSVHDDINTQYSDLTEDVTSLPYATPLSAMTKATSATVTPALTSSALDFSFATSQPDDGSSSSGHATIYFEPLLDIFYSISGETAGPNGGEMDFYLYNRTTNTQIVGYLGDASGPTPLLIDSSGGSLTGTLVADDLYELLVSQEVDVAGASSGFENISFAQVPEPSIGILIMIGLAFCTWCSWIAARKVEFRRTEIGVVVV